MSGVRSGSLHRHPVTGQAPRPIIISHGQGKQFHCAINGLGIIVDDLYTWHIILALDIDSD